MSRIDRLISRAERKLESVKKIIRTYLEDQSFDFDGEHDLSCLFFALYQSIKMAEKDNTEKLLTNLTIFLQSVLSDDDIPLHDALSVKVKSPNDANGYYWLMGALNLAAKQNNPHAVATITKTINAIIQKCDADKLIAGFTEKRTAGDETGCNALYFLMSSLAWAAEKNPNAVAAITQPINAIIQKCDADKLIAGLSEKRTVGDETGCNALLLLMSSLAWAANQNNPNAIAAITKTINDIIKKCDADKLIAGLTEKRTAGDTKGCNALYCLMSSLNCAAKQNNPNAVAAITQPINKIIQKCDANKLIAGLTEKRMAGNDASCNALYWLMRSLNLAANQNNPNAIAAITQTINAIIQKCDANKLIAGLSEKKTAGDAAGCNALYWLMSSLSWTAEKNPHAIAAITQTINDIIQKCGADKLIAGLSEKRTAGNEAGCNALYWLMSSLSWTAEKNPHAIAAITQPINKIIQKCDANKLIAGLSEKRTASDAAGCNALYCLMSSLSLTAEKNNPNAIATITKTINDIIQKCDANKLMKEFTEKRFGDTNLLQKLMKSFDQACDSKNKKIIAGSIIALIVKIDQLALSAEDKKIIFDKKNELKETIQEYLYQIKDTATFKKVSDNNSLFGQLIDHQRGFIKSSVTETRQYVNGLMRFHELDFKPTLIEKLRKKKDDLRAKIQRAMKSDKKMVPVLQERFKLISLFHEALSFQSLPNVGILLELVGLLNNTKWEDHVSDNELIVLRNHVVWYLSVSNDWIAKDDSSNQFSIRPECLNTKINSEKYVLGENLSPQAPVLKTILETKLSSLLTPKQDGKNEGEALLPSAAAVCKNDGDQNWDDSIDQENEATVVPVVPVAPSNNIHLFFARGDDGLADNNRCHQLPVDVYDVKSSLPPRKVEKKEDFLADYFDRLVDERKKEAEAQKAMAAVAALGVRSDPLTKTYEAQVQVGEEEKGMIESCVQL